MSALSKYVKVEELPSSKGIADVIFIPRSNEKLPAMIVELKWNKTAGGAIEQIKKKVSIMMTGQANILVKLKKHV